MICKMIRSQYSDIYLVKICQNMKILHDSETVLAFIVVFSGMFFPKSCLFSHFARKIVKTEDL